MKKVIIKDAEKAEEYGFRKRHIIGSDDEYDLYELQIRGKDALYFYQNSSGITEFDGRLMHYEANVMDLIAVAVELAQLGIAEVEDE